jgi:Ham1 family
MTVTYIDASDLRAAELRVFAPQFVFATAQLQTGFSTSAPSPSQKAIDKVLAAAVVGFAEAADLLTMDGKSLRLDLDSENENRFCRHWRETPTKMQVCFAIRSSLIAAPIVITVSAEGHIAEKPAGPFALGWDRLFCPAGNTQTLAQLCAAGTLAEFRRDAYQQVIALF